MKHLFGDPERVESDREVFLASRDAIVKVLRGQPEYDQESPYFDDEFENIVDNLALDETVRDFNFDFEDLYDWADYNLIWIGGDVPSSLPTVDT